MLTFQDWFTCVKAFTPASLPTEDCDLKYIVTLKWVLFICFKDPKPDFENVSYRIRKGC